MSDNTLTGCAAFDALCQTLIEEYSYLYPSVERTKSTDWIATIGSHHDSGRSQALAQGQGSSMDEACQFAVDDYAERQRVKRRKEELLKYDHVVEALELWGVKVEVANV